MDFEHRRDLDEEDRDRNGGSLADEREYIEGPQFSRVVVNGKEVLWDNWHGEIVEDQANEDSE